MNIKSIAPFISVLFFLFLFSGCSESVEEKLTGEWRATDVKIETGDEEFGREQLDALRRMEKSVVFVLNDDFTMNAVTGGSVINGFWSYDEEKEEVLVTFEGGNTEPTPLGKYTNGKLIKDHETGGISIKTVYEKR